MAGLALQKDTVVEFRGRRYTCRGRGPGGAYQLFPHKGRSNRSLKPEAAFDALAKGTLIIVKDTPPLEEDSIPNNHFEMSSLKDEEQNNVLMRHYYMQRLLKYRQDGGTLSTAALSDFGRRTHSDYVAECRKKERPSPKSAMSPAAIRRWFKMWTECGFKLIGLVRDARGNSHSKLTLAQEELLEAVIHEDYMNGNRKTAFNVHELLIAKINFENRARSARGEEPIRIPHYNTLLGHLNRIDLYDKLKARYNAAYAHKVTRKYGITPPTNRHLERIQIDHTQVDIYVDFGEKILVRPWLTLVLDSYSKAIMGYWLTPNPASSESVMQALRMAVMPKDMKKLGGNRDWYWPMYGVASELTLDNGKEFHGRDLEAAAAELGITLVFTPPRQPWYKAQIERKFGEINRSLLSQLPGQVFKYEPEIHGTDYPHLTLNEFKRIFLQWVTTVLHRRPNKEGYSPEELWAGSVQKYGMPGGGLPTDYIDLCLSKTGGEKILHADGIHHLDLTFNNEWLSRLRNELLPKVGNGKPKVSFKWSARDAGLIWVLHPETREYFPVLSKEEYAHGRSLYNHKVVLREQRNRRKARMEDASYTDAVLAVDQTVKKLLRDKAPKRKKTGSKVARYIDGAQKKSKPRGKTPTPPEPFDTNDPIQTFGDNLVDTSTGEILDQQSNALTSGEASPHTQDEDYEVFADDLEI